MLPGVNHDHQMIDVSLASIDMASKADFRAEGIGELDERWADRFPGMIQEIHINFSRLQHTSLSCPVRDLAELIGIINRLNCHNLPLLEVDIVSQGHERPGFKVKISAR